MKLSKTEWLELSPGHLKKRRVGGGSPALGAAPDRSEVALQPPVTAPRGRTPARPRSPAGEVRVAAPEAEGMSVTSQELPRDVARAPGGAGPSPAGGPRAVPTPGRRGLPSGANFPARRLAG